MITFLPLRTAPINATVTANASAPATLLRPQMLVPQDYERCCACAWHEQQRHSQTCQHKWWDIRWWEKGGTSLAADAQLRDMTTYNTQLE